MNLFWSFTYAIVLANLPHKEAPPTQAQVDGNS